MQTPKFGDFLLYDGTFVSAPADAKEVKGIYLYDGISLIDFSPKRKMYRKACHWCWEHGGELASVKTLYFIIFHFEEINRLRAGIGRDPLPEGMLVWSSCCLRNQGYTVLSYAVNLSTAMVHTLIGECVQLDDCGTANTVCVFGEPHDKRTNV